jgi:hypothetical protein
VLLPASRRSWQRATKDKEHAMSQTVSESNCLTAILFRDARFLFCFRARDHV